jgi:hypothetical protein
MSKSTSCRRTFAGNLKKNTYAKIKEKNGNDLGI